MASLWHLAGPGESEERASSVRIQLPTARFRSRKTLKLVRSTARCPIYGVTNVVVWM